MRRFYLVPSVEWPRPGVRNPKYFHPGNGIGPATGWEAKDYGLESCFLVSAEVTDAEHTALSAQVDVLAVPANLDSNVSALALTTIQTKLESTNLPGNWVTTSHTYRQVVRAVRRLIVFMQRFHGRHLGRLFESGVTLATQWNQLSQAQRQKLRDVADDLGLDYSGVTNTMTLRQILKLIADQLPDETFGGEAL